MHCANKLIIFHKLYRYWLFPFQRNYLYMYNIYLCNQNCEICYECIKLFVCLHEHSKWEIDEWKKTLDVFAKWVQGNKTLASMVNINYNKLNWNIEWCCVLFTLHSRIQTIFNQQILQNKILEHSQSLKLKQQSNNT